jgi:hypothetical protein
MYKEYFTDYINTTQPAVFILTLSKAEDDPMQVIKNHYHDSALMTAAHILISLTQEGKSIKEIASEDFDNNLELVSVWADYLVALNWIHYDSNIEDINTRNKWIVTDDGKRWVEKIFQ